jgi:hypothetical protein
MTSPVRVRRRTPPNVVVYRAVTVAITTILLVSLGLGLAGYGPFAALHDLTQQVGDILHLTGTGA